MARLLPLFALVFLLAACQGNDPAAPDQAASPATDAAADPAAADMVAAEPPAEAVADVPEVPEVPVGACGDQGELEPAERIANTPRWSTASELENFGFDVYRAESEEGPFDRLTIDPIPGAGTSDEPHQYSFRDDTIDPCVDYWYYVESVSTSGTREKFTPTFRAPAKRRAADD
ncbi:MAG: hypothetical protein M0Q42_09300 [Xanthomonadales bacterium]|nr:hypothetical protein [Xanthomonadales bacterium]